MAVITISRQYGSGGDEIAVRVCKILGYTYFDKKLLVKEVLQDRLVIIAPPGHPLTGKHTLGHRDLEGQLLIMHEPGSAPRKAIDDYIRKNNLSVKIPLEISSNRAIKRAVEDGLGIALISMKVAIEEIRTARLSAIPLSDPSMTRRFYMIHHKNKYLSEPLQSLIDRVFEWAAQYKREL